MANVFRTSNPELRYCMYKSYHSFPNQDRHWDRRDKKTARRHFRLLTSTYCLVIRSPHFRTCSQVHKTNPAIRLQYAIVLVAGVLSISAASASTVTSSKTITSDFAKLTRSLTTDQYDVTSTRFLRVESGTDEERGIKESLTSAAKSGFDKVTALALDQKLAWYLRNNEDMSSVFKKLRLVEYGDELFENPQFHAWVRSADKFNAKHKAQGKVVSSLPTLTTEFGDAKLARMIGTATKSNSATTKDVAQSLQNQLFNSWKNLPVDEVFKKLELNNGLGGIHRNTISMQPTDWTVSSETPLFFTFEMYLEEFYPNRPTMVMKALVRNYDDAKVSEMLDAAARVMKTRVAAIRLMDQQVASWKHLNAKDVYSSILHLDSTPGSLFDNPNFRVLDRFVYELTGGGERSLDALWKILGEEKFLQKVVEPIKTERGLRYIDDAQLYLLEKLLSSERTPAYVAGIAGTSNEGIRLANQYSILFRKRFHWTTKFR